MKFYTLKQIEEAKERLDDLRKTKNSSYDGMSSEEEFARRVELAVAEAQLNPGEKIKQFYDNFLIK